MGRVKILAAVLLAAFALLAAYAPAALAHRAFVTLHNGRDYAQVQEHHHRVVVCDYSSNGHRFGVEVRLTNGRTPRVFDSRAGGDCGAERFGREKITAVRWVCAEGTGRWRRG